MISISDDDLGDTSINRFGTNGDCVVSATCVCDIDGLDAVLISKVIVINTINRDEKCVSTCAAEDC